MGCLGCMSKQPKKTKKPAAKGKKATTKKSTLSATIRRIRAKNAAFKRMSPEKKRVAIAKDVLEQLDAKAIRAQKGTYFGSVEVEKAIGPYLNAVERRSWYGYSLTKSEQKALDTADQQVCDLFAGDAKCTVCGIGAAFVSAVRLGDDLKFKDLGSQDSAGFDDTTMRNYLKRYFDPPQVALIECAFEKDDGFANAAGFECAPDDADVDAAVDFGAKYESSSKRMRAIFQNIIEHNGTFVPPPVKDGADQNTDGAL